MSFDEFKFKRAYANKMLRRYLEKDMVHVSSRREPIEGTNKFKRITKTYIKSDDSEV